MKLFYHNPVIGALMLIFTVQTAFPSTAYTGGSGDGYGSAATSGDVSLPVELSTWTATSNNGSVTLNWATESETDNLGFIIERRLENSNTISEISSFQTNDDLIGQGSTASRSEYSYIDEQVEVGLKYVYELSDIDYKGTIQRHGELIVTVKARGSDTKPQGFAVLSAFPNPFNPSTTINYHLDKAGPVSIRIYNLQGAEIEALLINEQRSAGIQSISWHAADHNAGVYFCRFTQGTDVDTQKLMLLK